MKKTLLLVSAIVLLLTGCAKDRFADPQNVGGELTDVTFTALMDNGTQTKAAADGDGVAAKVNRCIMEIYYDGSLFTRMYAPVNDKKASFCLNLVSNRTYSVAFWADCVDDAKGEDGLKKDKYYKTDAEGGLKAVELMPSYESNEDGRDAFALCKNFTVEQAGSTFNAVLKRPFAQINVITNDVATVNKVPALIPEKVKVTLKKAAIKYNVLDSTTVAGCTDDLIYEADIYKWDGTKGECTLSMDYLFASSDKEVIDIDWQALHGTDAAVSHSFTNVPYLRNYRTNIKGALLTTTGKWNVTLNPDWETPDEDVTPISVDKPEDVKSALEQKATTSSEDGIPAVVSIETFDQTEDNYTIVIPEEITVTNTPGISFTANNVPAGKTLTITDESFGTPSSEYTGPITLVTDAETVVVKTNQAHFELVGNAKLVYANTSQNTFVIAKGYTVDKLIVEKGNVAVKGTVKDIERGDNNPDSITYVDIYGTGVWTNETEQKSEIIVPRRPNLIIGEDIFFDLQKAFDAAENNDVIELANNVDIFSTVTLDKEISVSLDLAGYTMTVKNNDGDGLVISNGAQLRLTNSIADHGIFNFITNSSRNDGIFVFNDKAGKTTSLDIVNPVKLICTVAKQNSTAHAEATNGKAVINLHEGASFIVTSDTGEQIKAVEIGQNSAFNMDGGLFDLKVNFNDFSYGNDVVGVLLWGYPSATNSVNISGGKFTVGGTKAFAQGIQVGFINGSNAGNTVNVSGGEINLAANSGGRSYSFTMVKNGTYNISGGKFTCDNDSESSELFTAQYSATNRFVKISGGQFFKKPDASFIPFGYAATCKDDHWIVEADPTLDYKEGGKSFGSGILVDGVIWAPVNCGSNVEEGGLFYQWGRKDGQKKTVAPKLSSEKVTDLSNIDPDTFYTSADNWLVQDRSDLWNAGTDADPVKSEYDPCPDGWRVATNAELGTLHKLGSKFKIVDGKYSMTTENGQTFIWPALGGRDADGNLCAETYREWAFTWSSNTNDLPQNQAWWHALYSQSNVEVIKQETIKADALPVRCVKIK